MQSYRLHFACEIIQHNALFSGSLLHISADEKQCFIQRAKVHPLTMKNN